MDFIERALAQGDGLSADGFLQAMADIYREPQVWQELDRYPQYVQDVIWLIDYDTEVQMEGLDGFVTGPHAAQYEQTCRALRNCGAAAEAELLQRAKALADRDPDYEDEAVEEELEALCRQTALRQDSEGFWDLVRAYIEKERL